MRKVKMNLLKWIGVGMLMLMLIVAGCSASNQGNERTDLTVILDWLPNTNHTGLYVAVANGYYEEEGLNIEIIIPGDTGAEAAVAAGNAHFGVSYQEGVTQSRIEGVPIVSIAAVIQHNTSGFASPLDRNINTPADFEGKTYGGWGNPVEEAVISALMDLEGADVNQVNILSSGYADFFTAVQQGIDFQWIFYGWDGVKAELINEPIQMIYVSDYADELDYYTPVLITSESMIADQPETVKAFMAATSKGYQYAIDHPEEAARILLQAEPDLDEELVVASQRWLSSRYQDDADRWGEQKREIWAGYATWMFERDLLREALDVDRAYTNDFLPN